MSKLTKGRTSHIGLLTNSDAAKRKNSFSHYLRSSECGFPTQVDRIPHNLLSLVVANENLHSKVKHYQIVFNALFKM